MKPEERRIKPAEWAVLGFTLTYVAGFTVWFLGRENYEFILYVLTMLGLIALVGLNVRKAEFPAPMLWALTFWGLAHMAGGGIPVGGSVLYSLQLIDIAGDGEFRILKYDQVVHAYGFGVTAWVLFHLLARHFPLMRGTWTIYTYPALASIGLGAVNEMIEFSAVVMMPETNVGGYYNTSLDLVFNAAGAIMAMLLVGWAQSRRYG
jgi:uncharacterized membrane protein YjdF